MRRSRLMRNAWFSETPRLSPLVFRNVFLLQSLFPFTVSVELELELRLLKETKLPICGFTMELIEYLGHLFSPSYRVISVHGQSERALSVRRCVVGTNMEPEDIESPRLEAMDLFEGAVIWS